MRLLFPALLALFALPAAAEPASKPAPKRVTLQLQRVLLRQAVDRLTAATGENVVVYAHVPDLRISLDVRNITMRDALLRLITDLRKEIPDLTGYQLPEAYVIKRRWLRLERPSVSSVQEFPELAERVSLQVTDTPFTEAVRQLVKPTGVSYLPGPSPWVQILADGPDPRISATVPDLPIDLGIHYLMQIARRQDPGITLRKESENFVIWHTESSEQQVLREEYAARARAHLRSPVRLELHDTPLRDAIRQIFPDHVCRWAVDPLLPDLPVTLRTGDLEPEAALRRVLAVAALQAPGTTYTRLGDFFLIHKGRPAVD